MADPNLSEIVATTLRNRSGVVADNVSDNIALLMRLRERGNRRPFGGGRTMIEEISYAENSTYKRFSGYDPIDISASDVTTGAEFEIKQVAVAVVMSGLEELQNAGDEQVIDLLSMRIENAERTMLNNLSADIYSDGSADAGKQVGGIQLLVSDAGTGTVGGINSSTWSFWQNQVYDFSDNSLAAGPATIQLAMNTLWLQCSRNKDHPDLWVADNTYYNYYWQSLQAIQRVTDPNRAMAGFRSLDFQGADVVFDGGLGGDAPSAHMYAMNTDYLSYRPHRRRDMVPLSPDRYATNQDAMVKLLGWAGNLTVRNRSLQGVIVA